MVRKCTTGIAFGALLAWFSGPMTAQDAKTVLSNAAQAMGVGNLQTIQYSGAGFRFLFGQAQNPNVPWPRFAMAMYNREIDFSAPASHVTITLNESEEQFIAPDAPWAQQVDIWVTPYGFLKGAIAAGNATVRSQTIGGKKYKVVSYTAEDRYPLNESRETPGEDYFDVTYAVETKGTLSGYINDQNMVERVDTWIDNPVLGDMLIESNYTAYRDFAGLKFPTRIVQKRGGFPVLDLTVTDVKANAAVSIQPPLSSAPAPDVQTEKITDGVFYIKGSYHSVAVEFKDYAAVIEAPVNEARSLAVIAETKKLIPNKPIKYLINTHSHFDHIGGIRTYVDEGATIVTHQINKAFYEKIFAMSHNLRPDKLSRSKKKANFETLTDRKVMTDGARTLELYAQKDNLHGDGLIFIYLPMERILVEADAYNPLVERLKLGVDRILPIHDPAS
jgi:hypothetical protein